VGDFTGQRRTVGCLDVAVATVREASLRGRALQYTFANRCDSAVVVDLAAVRAVGRDRGAGEVPLRLRDPRAEVRPIALEARMVGLEMLEYEPVDALYGWSANDRLFASLCVDVAHIEGPRADGSAPWLDVDHLGHDDVSVVCVHP